MGRIMLDERTRVEAYRTVLNDVLRAHDRAEAHLVAEQRATKRLTQEVESLKSAHTAATELAAELAQAPEAVELMCSQPSEMSWTEELQNIVDERDVALGRKKDLEDELAEASEALADVEKQLTVTIAERDEARAALKRAQTAQSSAESAEKSALERLAKAESQLNGTVGALREVQSALKTAERRVHELEGELEQLREANLTLTEETKSTPAASSAPVDATALRARLSAAAKWLDKDDPEMLAGALAGAFKELDRLEGK